MEKKLLALEQGSQADKPSPESSRSIEVHASRSPPGHGDQQLDITREPTAPSDQDDAVDGMGAVALKEGTEEDEYFGESLPPPFRASPNLGPGLTFSLDGDQQALHPT